MLSPVVDIQSCFCLNRGGVLYVRQKLNLFPYVELVNCTNAFPMTQSQVEIER